MEIREYRPEDCSEMASLFYDTVHTVNAADYTKEQLDAWADGAVDCEAWDHSFREHYTLVAIEDGTAGGEEGSPSNQLCNGAFEGRTKMSKAVRDSHIKKPYNGNTR